MTLNPGILLSDRYRLTRRIAVGGMGEVWAGDDMRLARQVAVKILRSELTRDPEFVDRFRAEARITASLNHSGIAAVYDYGEVASKVGGPLDTAFLVMELVSGEPLSAVLLRTPRLPVSRILDVLEQSGRALQVAHSRSLVHRDVKPGNILITPTGQVKITDFGIAKVTHQVAVTKGGMVMGTAQYLSPEQAVGRKSFPPSDVYSLGVVAYECLAGQRPFYGESPVAVAQAHVRDPPPPLPLDIPMPIAALVMQMLAKDPAHRFPDGLTLANAVASLRTGAAAGSAATSGAPNYQRSGGAPVTASAPARAPRTGVQSQARFATSAYQPTAFVLPGYPPPVLPRAAAGTLDRVQANYQYPVNRRTGLAVFLALLIVLAVAGACVFALNKIGMPGSSRDLWISGSGTPTSHQPRWSPSGEL